MQLALQQLDLASSWVAGTSAPWGGAGGARRMPLLGILLELQFGYLPAPKLVSNAAFLVSSPRGALPAVLGFCTGKVLFIRRSLDHTSYTGPI